MAEHLSFSFLSLPGVADPREWAHPVPDRARGGARRPFQESRDRGLASDGTECAAQCRYGAQNGEQPPLPAVLPLQLLLFLLSSPSCSDPCESQDPWEHLGTWLAVPSLSQSFLSLVYRDKHQGIVWNWSMKVIPGFI